MVFSTKKDIGEKSKVAFLQNQIELLAKELQDVIARVKKLESMEGKKKKSEEKDKDA